MILSRPLCQFVLSAFVFACLAASAADAQLPEDHVPAVLTAPANSLVLDSSLLAPNRAAQSTTLQTTTSTTPSSADQNTQPTLTEQQKAELQIQQQKKQRILGIFPNFNTTYIPDAAPLTWQQKYNLAFKSAVDPVTFIVAGVDAAYSQATDQFVGYGQGAQGYGKRLGASYADSFDGTMIGNAVLPALFHEDPRYFRLGTGSIKARAWYAVLTTVRTRDDHHKWVANYGNVLGNLAAGGISNLYYASSDRGTELTFERAATVTAEGALGSLFVEFWPDISRKLSHSRHPDATK